MQANTERLRVSSGMTRRRFLKAGAAGLTSAAVFGSFGCGVGARGSAGGAENYPERDITWIVPFSAGGGTDVYARQVAPLLGQELGVNIEVRNEPGAGSILGLREVSNSEPDGYTISNFNPPSSTIAQLAEGQNADFDLREMTHFGSIGATSYIIFARSDFEGDDLQSTLDLYESGQLEILAGQERGGPVELLAELMKERDGWNWQEYVGYEGGGDVTAAILRNEVPVGIASDTAALSGFESGDLKVIATTQNTRSPLYPDIPTSVQQGFEDLDFVARLTRVVAGPPDVPRSIQQTLAQALEAVITSQRTREWSENTGNPVSWGDPQQALEATETSFLVEERVPNLQELIGA